MSPRQPMSEPASASASTACNARRVATGDAPPSQRQRRQTVELIKRLGPTPVHNPHRLDKRDHRRRERGIPPGGPGGRDRRRGTAPRARLVGTGARRVAAARRTSAVGTVRRGGGPLGVPDRPSGAGADPAGNPRQAGAGPAIRRVVEGPFCRVGAREGRSARCRSCRPRPGDWRGCSARHVRALGIVARPGCDAPRPRRRPGTKGRPEGSIGRRSLRDPAGPDASGE